MKTNKQLLLSVLLLLMISCTETLTKSTYINSYEEWITQVKSEYNDYKEADWLKADNEFKSYSETQYNHFKQDLTDEELTKVDRLTGEYYGILAKTRAKEAKVELKSIMDKAQGVFEELKN
jgi:hypothetical protein